MIRLSADTEPDRFKEHVYEMAPDKIIILSEAPTAAIPLISEKQMGYFNNKLYFMVDSVLKETAVSSTA